MQKVAIIGAGISGVSLAYNLSRSNNFSVTVFDSNSEAGGCIKTVKKDDFQVESGPNGVLRSKTHVRDLYTEAGLADIIQYSSELTKIRYLQMSGYLHKAPSSPVSAVTTKILSGGGKLRLLREPWIPKREDGAEETIAEFTTRRLGKEAADNLIATLVGGIYAGDTNKLSMAAAFPSLYALEQTYGGIIRGVFGKSKAAKAEGKPKKNRDKEGYKLMSGENGMQGLVKELANKCKAEFVYNTKIKNIEKTENGYNVTCEKGGTKTFDKVALCCNAHDIAEITKGLDQNLSAEMAKVEFAPVFICGMGFEEDDIYQPLDGFGYLVTPSEKSIVLGTLFSSSLFEGRVPDRRSLITVITVGDRNRDMFAKSDKELSDIAFDEVKDVLKIHAKPRTLVTFRHERAMPQYYVGHLAIKNNVDEILKNHSGLYIGGNTFGGVSIADCIATSTDLAEQILK